MRPGVRLALDIGNVRIGVASCDNEAILCTPVETLFRDKRGDGHILDILDLIEEYQPMEVIVGLPRNMDGTEGRQAKDARRVAHQLLSRTHNIDVRLVDERLTSVSAHRALHEAGRSQREHKAVVDQVAAVLILELALEIEARTGEPAGESLRQKGRTRG